MRIVVDIDGILTNETSGHDYYNRTPNTKSIKLLHTMALDNEIILFSSRYFEDYFLTKGWLAKYNIPYDILLLGIKPSADAYIDDKSLPYLEPNIEFYLNYEIGGTCWRFKHGEVSEDEIHPCFFCGHKIPLITDKCPVCRLMRCPDCGRCICNIPLLSRITLVKIHQKYCCNLPDFNGIIELEGFADLDIIRHSKASLQYCKEAGGLNGTKGI